MTGSFSKERHISVFLRDAASSSCYHNIITEIVYPKESGFSRRFYPSTQD
jgi:hypothetical protein